LAALVFLVVVLAAGCKAGAAAGSPVGMGATATDFAIRDTRGGTFRLSNHLGKEVILLDFWSTWCPPCLVEMPHLEDLYEQKRARGFLVVGISMDGPETAGEVPSFAQRYGIQFPVVMDEDLRVTSAYNPKRLVPFTVLIDRQGKITKVRDSYVAGDEDRIAAEVTTALDPNAN
jgi:peroxiredoxin